jgi:hypothetical protein
MKPGSVLLLISALLLAGCLGSGPSPPGNVTYTPPQLKYVLLDHYGEGNFFFCDPDYYPIARDDEAEKAVVTFPEIQEDTTTFAAIVIRKGLQPPYSNETKLTIYREFKRLRAIPLDPVGGGAYSFSLQLGTFSEGRRVSGTIRDDGVILGERSEEAVLTCPICLSGDTLIDTPAGQVPVKDIGVGMLVWTPGPGGVRRAVPVQKTVQTRVPPLHHILHLRLSDGRELSASPGHPTLDGRAVGTLSIGDELDGSTVIGADLVLFSEEFTYDILPAGETGGYWANGIPLESTLFQA